MTSGEQDLMTMKESDSESMARLPGGVAGTATRKVTSNPCMKMSSWQTPMSRMAKFIRTTLMALQTSYPSPKFLRLGLSSSTAPTETVCSDWKQCYVVYCAHLYFAQLFKPMHSLRSFKSIASRAVVWLSFQNQTMDEDALLEDDLQYHYIWYSCEPILERKNGKAVTPW